MTTATALRPTPTMPASATPEVAPSGRMLGSVVAAASDVVAELPLDDLRWDRLGPALTKFVHAARLAAGMPGSPIRPDETVGAVLRLRDLARLAQSTATSVESPTLETEAGLRSLQAAAAFR